jgi:hypothetical protein
MRPITTLCALIMFAGCTPFTVQHDYDPSIDFSRYHSFAWMPLTSKESGTSTSLSGPFLAKRIRRAIALHLVGRDFTFEPEEPDMLVAYQIRYQRRSRVDVRAYGYSRFGHQVDDTRDLVATFIVDFVDPMSGDLIWRGWAVSDVHRAASPEEEQKLIVRAVRKLLERFPPNQEGG